MKVLIAIDSSDFSEDILKHVVESNWSADSVLRVISVYEPAPSWEITQLLARQVELILEYRLEQLKKTLSALQIEGKSLEGPASTSILDEAKDWHCDLLIIGSHGDTGVRKNDADSISSSILKNAPCTVQVVRVSKEDRYTSAA